MLKRTLMINGQERKLVVDPEETLANVLRNKLLLTGTKVGCNQGQCGCCSVILDVKAVRFCITKMKRVLENAAICMPCSWPWSRPRSPTPTYAADTPQEIAVSIVAQLIQKRAGMI